jgi:hypothetical protein
MLATVWLDIVFVPLLLAGVESMEPIPGGVAGAFGQIIIHADWTHSLVGALLLSALFGLAGGWAWGRFTGLVLAAVSFSHWLLDLVVHRADMPVLPANWGGLPLLGFGLWASPRIELMLEGAIILVGAFLYWRTALAVSTASGEGRTRPAIVAALIALGGAAILAYQATTIGT